MNCSRRRSRICRHSILRCRGLDGLRKEPDMYCRSERRPSSRPVSCRRPSKGGPESTTRSAYSIVRCASRYDPKESRSRQTRFGPGDFQEPARNPAHTIFSVLSGPDSRRQGRGNSSRIDGVVNVERTNTYLNDSKLSSPAPHR
jgi:hypothetical protein